MSVSYLAEAGKKLSSEESFSTFLFNPTIHIALGRHLHLWGVDVGKNEWTLDLWGYTLAV